jgi:hypothetical protein
MKPRSAIKNDLFANEHYRKKLDAPGDPLSGIDSRIDFAALAAGMERIAPRPASPQGGRPPYPTETMARILVLKRLYSLSDEQGVPVGLQAVPRSGQRNEHPGSRDRAGLREPHWPGRGKSLVRWRFGTVAQVGIHCAWRPDLDAALAPDPGGTTAVRRARTLR